jgi:hypothetical protein
MRTLVPGPPLFAAAPIAPQAGGQHVLVLLLAAFILVIAISFMWRAVGPVLEILKAALYAVSTFLLVALVVALLVVVAFTR